MRSTKIFQYTPNKIPHDTNTDIASPAVGPLRKCLLIPSDIIHHALLSMMPASSSRLQSAPHGGVAFGVEGLRRSGRYASPDAYAASAYSRAVSAIAGAVAGHFGIEE